MVHREKIHLLPALLVAADTDGSPVTYVVLSLRLAGLGGDRACRPFIEELKTEDLIRVERKSGGADPREMAVSVTTQGWRVLERYAELVRDTCGRRGAAPRTDRFEGGAGEALTA